VVGTPERQNPPPAGHVQGQGERHEVRLGAGVREPHEVHAGEAAAQQLGELVLEAVGAAETDASAEGRAHGRDDLRVRVPVEAGSEVAQKVGVTGAVDRPEVRTLAAIEG
jgi:hypothetical protein